MTRTAWLRRGGACHGQAAVGRGQSSAGARLRARPPALAKTDRIDADTLALFTERVRPEPRALPDDSAQALDALLTRRRQILGMVGAEYGGRNRISCAPSPASGPSLAAR